MPENHQTTLCDPKAGLPSEAHRNLDNTAKPPAMKEGEAAPEPDGSSRLGWKVMALSVFVLSSWGAFAYAVHVILERCQGK